ncbi:hypothetical protein ACLQ29_24430 [Micromonospora sp. DT228]
MLGEQEDEAPMLPLDAPSSGGRAFYDKRAAYRGYVVYDCSWPATTAAT